MALILALCLSLISAQSAFAQSASIDSPFGNSSVQSGAVSPPNGWKCPRAGAITARIDSGDLLQFTEDLSRGDTAASGRFGVAARELKSLGSGVME